MNRWFQICFLIGRFSFGEFLLLVSFVVIFLFLDLLVLDSGIRNQKKKFCVDGIDFAISGNYTFLEVRRN